MISNKGNALASVTANYIKRLLEDYYNNLGKTAFFESLKSKSGTAKLSIEAAMYALTAFLDQKISRDTFLKKTSMEVFTDMAPELAKRIINGTKEQIRSQAKTDEEITLASSILELDDETLKNLLSWLFETDPTERKELINQIGKLAIEEQMRLIQLPKEQIKQYFDIFNTKAETSSEKPTTDEVHQTSPKIGKFDIDQLRGQIHEKRLRLQANRKRGILW